MRLFSLRNWSLGRRLKPGKNPIAILRGETLPDSSRYARVVSEKWTFIVRRARRGSTYFSFFFSFWEKLSLRNPTIEARARVFLPCWRLKGGELCRGAPGRVVGRRINGGGQGHPYGKVRMHAVIKHNNKKNATINAHCTERRKNVVINSAQKRTL